MRRPSAVVHRLEPGASPGTACVRQAYQHMCLPAGNATLVQQATCGSCKQKLLDSVGRVDKRRKLMLYRNLCQVGQKQRVCETCRQNTIVQLCGATRCEPPHLAARRPNDTAVHSMPDSCHHVCATKCCPKHIQDNLLLTHEGHNTWRSLCQFRLFEHDGLQTYRSQAFVASADKHGNHHVDPE